MPGILRWAMAVLVVSGCTGGGGGGGQRGDGGGADGGGHCGADGGAPADGGSSADGGVPEGDCAEGGVPVPCNGCPVGTEVPVGFACAPAGVFIEGDDMNTREVTLTQDVFIQKTEVTQGEWQALMGSSPAGFEACGGNAPVEQVSWLDAVAFANAKSASEDLQPFFKADGSMLGGPTPYACEGYRLPTSAEWEYAYRAGTLTAYFWGDDEEGAGDFAWYAENAGATTHPVRQKLPNAWGLYDMAGNVWEWVHDGYADFRRGAVTDPAGPPGLSDRLLRGGAWDRDAESIGAAYIFRGPPDFSRNDIGFRLARSRRP